MQTVSSQLGQPQLEAFTAHAELVSADAIGIELELEGFTGDTMDSTMRLVRPLWNIIGDGSLRNGGVEFITQGGFGGEKLVRAIDKLQTVLERVNYDASWRCSTHMHINMLDFNVNQVARFILVYAACEPILFEFCGAYRKSSNFCTPLGDSLPFHRKIMSRMYDDAISRRSPQQVANKYVALNVLPLFPDQRGRALGTVEFRGGRPLVSRTEMLLQANLLLSIKQYVRDFQGDEEAMLVELGNGVHNTVYANGVAAGINSNPEALELALVNAWALLKSYQQGRAQGAQEAARQAERDALPEGMPPVGSSMSRARGLTMGAHIDSLNMSTLETLGQLTNYVQERTWPALHTNFENLRDTRDPHGMLFTAFEVCLLPSTRQHQPLSQRNITVALMNWAGLLTNETAEQTPVNTLIRLRRNTNIGGARHNEPSAGIPGINPQVEISASSFSNSCLYQQSMSPSQWRELQEKCGFNRMSTNRDIWNWLLEHRVRLKGRTALNEAIQAAGSRNYTGWDLNSQTISTVTLIRLLRLCGLNSEAFVWTADRAEYDKMVYVLAVLSRSMVKIPFVSVDRVQLGWCPPDGLGRNSGQGFSETAIGRNNSTLSPIRVVSGYNGNVNVY